jgi:ring-1,2-phenylacetyl-CoA epoxidase subunit PaaC
MQAALDELWPYALQMFTPGEEDPLLIESGYIADPGKLRTEWEAKIIPFFRECELAVPQGEPPRISRHEHTPHLKVLLADMQSVARLEPDGEW